MSLGSCPGTKGRSKGSPLLSIPELGPHCRLRVAAGASSAYQCGISAAQHSLAWGCPCGEACTCPVQDLLLPAPWPALCSCWELGAPPLPSAGRSWLRHMCPTVGTEGAPAIPAGLSQASRCQPLQELALQLLRVLYPVPPVPAPRCSCLPAHPPCLPLSATSRRNAS